MEQIETDMRNAAAWKPMCLGLKMQIAGLFVHLLGIVLASFCVIFVLYLYSGTQRHGVDGVQQLALIMFFIGNIFAVIGSVILLASLFWLARIPTAAKVGRWAPWGMCSLPASIGIVATGWAVLFSNLFSHSIRSTPLPAPWLILSLFAAILLFFGMFCISHLLRATASFWNAAALGWQFAICLTALCGLVVFTLTSLLALNGNLPNGTLHDATNSYLRRTCSVCVIVPSVGYLLLMSWHLVLVRRLLARVPIASNVPEPQVSKSS